MALKEFTDLVIPELEKEISAIIDINLTNNCSLLKQMFAYHLGLDEKVKNKGKRFRPLLVLLTTKACGGNWEKAISAASAIEFLHNFSLIHDDIEDQSDLRRGRPTVWSKWGVAQAINTGDGMFALVFSAINRLMDQNGSKLANQASELITTTCIRLVEGQAQDVNFEDKINITPEDYWKMIGGKTAALIGCSTKLGGLIAGKYNQLLDLIYQFGYQLGLTFQVQDDFLGIWGNTPRMGKSSESDLMNHKLTLPVIYGLQMSPRFLKRWKQGNFVHHEIPLITDWLKEDGVYDRVKISIENMNQEMNQYFNHDNFIDKEGMDMLFELVDSLRGRDN
jgi:geranylgeranyl diphosphate synthase type I